MTDELYNEVGSPIVEGATLLKTDVYFFPIGIINEAGLLRINTVVKGVSRPNPDFISVVWDYFYSNSGVNETGLLCTDSWDAVHPESLLNANMLRLH